MRSPLTLLAGALAAAPALVAAADVYKDWTVGWVNGVNPDGMKERRAIGVNGQWPPEIIVSGRDRGAASSPEHRVAHIASPARDLC